MKRKFNFIYAELVRDEDDIVGHVTYSLYKANKVRYIERFTADQNRVPDEDELDAYHRIAKSTTPALKIHAVKLLSDFVDITLDKTVSIIEAEMKTAQENLLRDIIAPLIPPKPKGPWAGFWMSVLVKGAQTLVVGAFIFLIIFASKAKDDFWGTLHSWLPVSHSFTPK